MIRTRDAATLLSTKTADAEVSILKQPEGRIIIRRFTFRGKVLNLVDRYERHAANGLETVLLDEAAAHRIVQDLVAGKPWSDCFLVDAPKLEAMAWERSEAEHKFTSTGIKFWRHREQMESFRASTGRTVISTHISPEGSCNLRCSFCSVTARDTHSRIPFERIKAYVYDLKSRGLKAVIFTGGGEPTLYPEFNELVQWTKAQGLSVALITNGTTANRVDRETWKCFSWVRVSINVFDGWKERIHIPYKELSKDCVVGCSFVYTVEHEAVNEVVPLARVELLREVGRVAEKCGATYIRVLPNCLLEQEQLVQEHHSLKADIEKLGDLRFFQQYKVHGAPKASQCHQSFFRPYLSEEPFVRPDGSLSEPGTVYPCDSVVLNNSEAHFATKYQLCTAEDVLDYMDGKIKGKFTPEIDCTGCVFTSNVEMLGRWKETGEGVFVDEAMVHEEFV